MLKEKFKKINIRDIGVIVFCIIMLYSFLLVGSPLENNIQITNVLFNIVCIIVIIIKCKKNEKLELSKMDFLVFALILVGFIPIIFKTKSSLTSTVDSILKYVAVFNAFITVKYIVKTDKKYINYITNTIIVASILLIIFGIDMMHDNIFQKVYDFLNTIIVPNSSNVRMDSLYEYPNSFAMFLGVALILSIGSISRVKKSKLKLIFYILTSIFLVYGIIMSGSRLTMLLIFAVMLLWCIIERKKILNKKVIIIASSIIVLFVIAIILCYKIDTPLVLFDETNKEKSQYIKQINNVSPNAEYDFNFDISAKNDTDQTNKFRIIVRELTKEADNICENRLEFDTFEGTKNIHIKTNENTDMFRICFVSDNDFKEKTRLEVKGLTINGQKVKLKYYLIPINIINRVENITTDESSITERFIIIKDGIKLGMQKAFTGFGCDGWRYNYKTVREHNYGATQMHCYIVDVFIQNGIVGLILITLFLILLAYKIIKVLWQKQSKYYPIVLACAFGFMHAILDFDMNFYAILILMYSLASIIDIVSNGKNITIKKQNIFRIIVLILMLATLVINTGAYYAYKIEKTEEDDKSNYEDFELKQRKANLKVKLASYNYRYLADKVQVNLEAKDAPYINLNIDEEQKVIDETIELLNNIIKNEPDRDILSYYRRLILTYIENISENNVDEMADKIEEVRIKIEDKLKKETNSQYGNTMSYILYYEIQSKLEEINETLQNEKIKNICEEINNTMQKQNTQSNQDNNNNIEN